MGAVILQRPFSALRATLTSQRPGFCRYSPARVCAGLRERPGPPKGKTPQPPKDNGGGEAARRTMGRSSQTWGGKLPKASFALGSSGANQGSTCPPAGSSHRHRDRPRSSLLSCRGIAGEGLTSRRGQAPAGWRSAAQHEGTLSLRGPLVTALQRPPPPPRHHGSR